MKSLNLPNKITLSRIFIIPLVVFFYLATFVPQGKLIAAVLFVFGVATDFIDGIVARKLNMVTSMGKFLDPIADKLIVMAALLLVVVDGTLPAPYGVIFAIIVLGREFAISAFRQVAATKNVIIAADKLGKVKAFLQDVALALLMVLAHLYVEGWSSGALSPSHDAKFVFYEIVRYSGYVLVALSAALTIVSLVNYLVKNNKVLTDEKNI